jgi:hypothetical protein
MNPSGGLFWHLHAWRHQAQWSATCADIAQWLGQMPPSKDAASELVIVGASAGWMMPSAWLQRFHAVTTFDLDRWAAPLFRLRHGAALRASDTTLQCNTADALTDLGAILQAHPRALVLFDNVLGQLRFHTPSVDEASRRIETITARMHGRRWGSVHDAFSGRTQGHIQGRNGSASAPVMQRSVQAPAPTSASAATRPVALGRFSRQLHAQGEWLDHLTDHVFPAGTSVHHIAWPYSPGYCHWLQAGWINP